MKPDADTIKIIFSSPTARKVFVSSGGQSFGGNENNEFFVALLTQYMKDDMIVELTAPAEFRGLAEKINDTLIGTSLSADFWKEGDVIITS